MSKFGAGGGGAPLRDQFGNIVAQRKPGEALAAQNLSEAQIKQMQRDQYQKDLQDQI